MDRENNTENTHTHTHTRAASIHYLRTHTRVLTRPRRGIVSKNSRAGPGTASGRTPYVRRRRAFRDYRPQGWATVSCHTRRSPCRCADAAAAAAATLRHSSRRNGSRSSAFERVKHALSASVRTNRPSSLAFTSYNIINYTVRYAGYLFFRIVIFIHLRNLIIIVFILFFYPNCVVYCALLYFCWILLIDWRRRSCILFYRLLCFIFATTRPSGLYILLNGTRQEVGMVQVDTKIFHG